MSDEVNLDELAHNNLDELAHKPLNLNFEVEIEGQPLTSEMRVIGALVRRLGGMVVLTPTEMDEVQGVVLRPVSEDVCIDAGNTK